MVRIITFDNPDILENEKTLLSSSTAVGATSLSVDSSVDYAVGDVILVGEPANDGAEIATIATIPDVNTMTISSGLAFAHEEMSLITKLDFDQAKIYKSTDDVTFALAATIALDYQDSVGKTKYTDTAGLDTDYYRYSFANSSSGAETAQSRSIPGFDNTEGYLSIQEFIENTGINGPPNQIAGAIKTAARQMRLKLYTKWEYRAANTPSTEHWLQLHDRCDFIADGNLDGKIDKNDFYAYEEDPPTTSIPGARTDVTSDITAVDVNREVVSFGTAHPTANKTLFIEYYTGPRKLEDMLPLLSEINELLAVNHIFKRIPYGALCSGIAGWSLNGVSINFSREDIKGIIESNEKEVRQLIYELQPIRTRFVSGRDRYNRTNLATFKGSLSFRSNSP